MNQLKLKVNTSILFNFDFAFFHFFPLFIVVDLYFLILAAIAQIFNTITVLVILLGIPIEEIKTEVELHPVNVELK